MRATVYHGPRDMRIDQVPDPIIEAQQMWLPALRMRGFVARICGLIVVSINVSREIVWDTSG
jgi:hypothetical protein